MTLNRRILSQAAASCFMAAGAGLSSLDAEAVSVIQTITTANNAAAWTISAEGLTGTAQQLAPFPNYISVSSNGDSSGSMFNEGFDNSTWNGVWSASYKFAIPTGATDVSLRIGNIEADDKIVVQLNGTNIPGADYVVTNSKGLGSFNFGAGQTPFAFNGFTPPVDTTTGFLVGDTNTLTLFINNTGNPDPSSPSVHLTPGIDGTTATFTGALTFTSAVPEPSSAALTAIGLALSAILGRRRIKRISMRPLAR